jgi:hypothetical protein
MRFDVKDFTANMMVLFSMVVDLGMKNKILLRT